MDQQVEVGIIGEFDPDLRYHIATNEALNHAAEALSVSLKRSWISTHGLSRDTIEAALEPFHALWCAPGDYKSVDGALLAIQYAREHDRPFIGTWGGFQYALLEYARNALGIGDAQHEETAPHGSTLVVSKLACSLVGKTQTIKIASGSLFHNAYGQNEVSEQFVCNYGLNPKFRDAVEKGELKVAGVDLEGEVRAVEVSNHPFYIGTLYQPQISSSPNRPHPLISAYLKAALRSVG